MPRLGPPRAFQEPLVMKRETSGFELLPCLALDLFPFLQQPWMNAWKTSSPEIPTAPSMSSAKARTASFGQFLTRAIPRIVSFPL